MGDCRLRSLVFCHAHSAQILESSRPDLPRRVSDERDGVKMELKNKPSIGHTSAEGCSLAVEEDGILSCFAVGQGTASFRVPTNQYEMK
jgi:hypothetical protein